MTYAAAGLVVTAVFQAVMLVWLARRMRAIVRLDDRLSRLTEALALLTDTTECGFRTMAERPAARAARAPRAGASPGAPGAGGASEKRATRRRTSAATVRVARAARRGTSVQAIAAAERVSEGEVRLRLHVAEADAAAARPQ